MGRLTAPYSALGIRQVLGPDSPESIANSLQEMAGLGMPAAGLAQSLEMLAAALAERPRIEDLVKLVATGPQVSGVANRDTSVVVSELFGNAENSVVVIGYTVYQGQQVFKALASRMSQRVDLRVRMYLDIGRKAGDSTTEIDLVRRFCHAFSKTQWPAGNRLPEIYYDPRSAALRRANAASLHAKCVVVDDRDVFVSSANFTQAGQARNIELGLLLQSPTIAGRIVSFFEQLVGEGHLKRAM